MSAGKPITEHGLRLRKKKKNYYSCPSVNHAPPPGNVAKKERDRGRERERERGGWEGIRMKGCQH